MVVRCQVHVEKGEWVAGEGVSLQDDGVSFKKLVGLVARQKKLKGVVGDDNRVAFDKFVRVSKAIVLWPGELTQVHERKEPYR